MHSELSTVECDPYHALLLAKTCAQRFEQANSPQPNRWNKLKNGCGDLTGCRGCPVGERVLAQVQAIRNKKNALLLADAASDARARSEAFRLEAEELEKASEEAAKLAQQEGATLLDDSSLDALEDGSSDNFVPTWKVRRSR